ncbi:hypothetical protein ACFX13_013228 [Malus domestica]
MSFNGPVQTQVELHFDCRPKPTSQFARPLPHGQNPSSLSSYLASTSSPSSPSNVTADPSTSTTRKGGSS